MFYADNFLMAANNPMITLFSLVYIVHISEVLKQVWDLSDQDNDSMLSLREFCCALYMMERYREGRPLPAALPSNIMYDETLLSLTGQPKVTYANAAWGPGPGPGPSPGIDLNFF